MKNNQCLERSVGAWEPAGQRKQRIAIQRLELEVGMPKVNLDLAGGNCGLAM